MELTTKVRDKVQMSCMLNKDRPNMLGAGLGQHGASELDFRLPQQHVSQVMLEILRLCGEPASLMRTSQQQCCSMRPDQVPGSLHSHHRW